jgi:hypothetical protein
MRATPRMSAPRGDRWRATFDPAPRSGRAWERRPEWEVRRDCVLADALRFFFEPDPFFVAIASAHTSMTTGTITGLRFVVSMKNRRSAVRM